MMAPGRYDRQISVRQIGREGQLSIERATVVVVGVGATGGAIAAILARAGVGCIRLVDRDVVEWSNLQRQTLFQDSDAREGLPKAVAAARALRCANGTIEIEGVIADLVPRNAERLLRGAACIVDGTDNFETRLLMNDFAVQTDTPWVYSGVVGTVGHALSVNPGAGACFRCYLPEIPAAGSVETCDTAGVLGTTVQLIAGVSGTEALKALSGRREEMSRTLAIVDCWEREWRAIEIQRDPQCPCCARGELEFLRGGAVSNTVTLCGRNAVQIRPPTDWPVDLRLLADRLEASGSATVRRSEHVLRLKIGELEATVFGDGRAIVHGTDDPGRARALYARFVGL